MKNSRTWRVPLWAGLLFLGSPVLSFGTPDAIGEYCVVYEQKFLSLRADDAPLDLLLQDIAAKADLRLIQHIALDRRVSARFDRATLPDVLAELLQDTSYQLYVRVDAPTNESGDDPIPSALWIFAEGSVDVLAATAYLELALVEGDSREKRESIRELRRIGTPEAVRVLSMALGEDDAGIRHLAIEALSRIGGDDALAAIASLTADNDVLTRGRAAEAIAMTGGASAVAYLEIALHDPNPRVRAAAVDSLVELDAARAGPMLRDALQDPDPDVRARALDVMENLEDEALFEALSPFD